MNISELIDDVLDVAELVAPLIVPGAGPMIEAGKKLAGVLEKAKADVAETSAERLNETLTDLEARVFAHADQTEDNLRQ